MEWPGIEVSASAMAYPISEGTNAQCTRSEQSPISSILTILDCYMLLNFGTGGEKMPMVI